MSFFFDRERRLRAEAAQAFDCASTARDPARRLRHLTRARSALGRVSQSEAEALLLTLG
jgi:hypothetical protein